jgi:2-methylcitrate dehydratase
VTLKSGEVISDELAVADAYPLGARPFRRPQYLQKFAELADDVVEPAEQRRFLAAVDSLPHLEPGALDALNIVIDPRVLDNAPAIPPGIFR